MSYASPADHQHDAPFLSARDPWSSTPGSRYSEDDISFGHTVDMDDTSSYRSLIRSKSNASRQDQKEPHQAMEYPVEEEDVEYDRKGGFSLKRLRPNRSRAYTQGSLDSQPSVFQGGFATRKSGWWKRQMLVDRSLRSMAALMTVFAFAMVVLCASYFSAFLRRGSSHSTSVGARVGESCKAMETQNTVCLSCLASSSFRFGC